MGVEGHTREKRSLFGEWSADSQTETRLDTPGLTVTGHGEVR